MKTIEFIKLNATRIMLILGCANLAGPPTHAELIPAARRTVWQPGVTYNGGITNRSVIYQTLTPGPSDTAAIQNAIDTCPDGQVVLLGPGLFHLSGAIWIRRSNVTLRGAGPLKTRLLQTLTPQNPPPVILIGLGELHWVQPAPFVGDGVKGTKSITLQSNPGLQVGEIVHVTETYDPSLTKYYHTLQTNSLIYLGWGEGQSQNGPGGSVNKSRPIGQAMEIESIAGNQLTFTTPFHMTFRANHAAHLARLGQSDADAGHQPTTRVGVEDVSLGYGGGGDGGGNIRVFGASYCWIKNIESDHSSGAAVAFDGCFRCEVRDSYLHETVNPTPGGAGYGLEIDRYSADCLVENNISWSFNKVMVMRSSGGGNVIAYNYMTDGFGSYYPNNIENGLNASHMTTPHMELFEGNESFNFSGDPTWGNSIFVTAFRNQLTSQRAIAPPLNLLTYSFMDGNCALNTAYFEDEYNRRAIGLSQGHYWYNFVGNVLGYQGMTLLGSPRSTYKLPQTGWEYDVTGDGNKVPMWSLGDGDNEVKNTAIRHGNYDYFTQTTVWDATNTDHTLPDSLYLSNKPAFFGSAPWPIVRPENTASPIAGELPAKARFKALVYPNATRPAIVSAPTNRVVNVGDEARFSVVAAFGEALSYQWFHNGQDLVGQTSSTLVLPNVQRNQAGRYAVAVTSPSGAKSQPSAELSFTTAQINLFGGLKIQGKAGERYLVESADATKTNSVYSGLRYVTLENDTELCFECLVNKRKYRAVSSEKGQIQPTYEAAIAPGVQIDGIIGHQYRIEYLETLQAPGVWKELKTFTLATPTQVFIDYEKPASALRVYRAVPVD